MLKKSNFFSRDLPKDWVCECGKIHNFGVYYAAHSFEELQHTCQECGAVHLFLNYSGYLVIPGRWSLRGHLTL